MIQTLETAAEAVSQEVALSLGSEAVRPVELRPHIRMRLAQEALAADVAGHEVESAG